MRVAKQERKTTETDINLRINLDGTGIVNVSSGIGFFDHMLTLLAVHGNLDLDIKCVGDTNVDMHHTVEDIGLVLGKAIKQALGDRKGIARYADCTLPMDESLAKVTIDISGRPYLVYNADILSQAFSNDFDFQLINEFFYALSINSGITIHINLLYGNNYHHIAESIFKAFARAFSSAIKVIGDKVPSSKGLLD